MYFAGHSAPAGKSGLGDFVVHTGVEVPAHIACFVKIADCVFPYFDAGRVCS